MILIDSNMWCFYFDESSKENVKVSESIEEILKKEQVLSNSVVIMEVSHFLVKNLGSRIGRTKIDAMLSFPMTIIDVNFSLMKHSIDMLCDYSHTGIGGRDATLLAALRCAEANRIMTHDEAFKKIDWIDVFDPLQGKASNKKGKNKHGVKSERGRNTDYDN